MIPKFRARDQRGNWHIGLLTFMFGQYAIVNESDENTVYLIDKETIGQSTGLKDKNGMDIFDGDIGWDDHQEVHGQVIFENGAFKYEWDNISEDLFEATDDIEIVGNIYENLELLEGIGS